MEVLNKSCTFESLADPVGLTSWAIADIEYQLNGPHYRR
jgi:hypothetical protein